LKTTRTLFCLMAVVLSIAVPSVKAQFVCQRAPMPVSINGSIGVGDVQQSGRISRDGLPSSCIGSFGELENGMAVRRDTHNLINPFNETVCVRVEQDFSSCANNQMMSVAYSLYNPAFPALSVIGDPGFSTVNRGSYSFSVGPNANFAIVVHEVEPNTGCPLYNLRVTYLRNCRQAGFDRTNDGRADPTLYRVSASSQWHTLDSATNQLVSRTFGTVGDIVTGGSDYTGDGQTDLSVYRPSSSTWYYGLDQNSPGSSFQATPWGATGDRAVPGDYDGDGLNDIAIWRPSDGTYYLLRSSDGTLMAFQWGMMNDIPVFGDFDGDTLTDFSVVRQTSDGSIWYLQKSNYSYGFNQAIFWGLPTDRLVPGDYDGDSITDLAVFRPTDGAFYVRRSSNLALQIVRWGVSGDTPQPADYDGDKKMDFAVYRSSAQVWYILNSATSTFTAIPLGLPGDIPVTAPYRIQ
jgi:hypothetical protein